MSDRYAVEVILGGSMHMSLVPRLCELIRAEDLSPAYGDACFQPENAADLLVLVAEQSQLLPPGCLHLFDAERCYGDTSEFQMALVQLSVPFRVFSEGSGDEPPTLAFYDPATANMAERGTLAVKTVPQDGCGKVLVRQEFVLSAVESYLRRLEAGCYGRAGSTDSYWKAACTDLRTLVMESIEPIVPELPPFKLGTDPELLVEYACRRLERDRWRPDSLDELVLDCMQREAAEHNNGGFRSQLRFLLEHLGVEGLMTELASMEGRKTP